MRISYWSSDVCSSDLHALGGDTNETHWRVVNPKGQHAIAVGLSVPVEIEIEGHAGYYCAGMNKQAKIVVHGHCGVGIAENIMSGEVRVKGRSEEHTSELQSLMRISYAVLCLKKKKIPRTREKKTKQQTAKTRPTRCFTSSEH